MTDAIAKAEATVAKWTASVAKLRAEVARRETSGRKAKALDRARAQLAKAERHAANAADRLDRIRQRRADSDRIRAEGAAIADRFGHLEGLAAQTNKRWQRERKDEAKRIAKRKKAIERRTTKDLRGSAGEATRAYFGIRRQRAAQPIAPDEAETWPKGPIVPYVAPKAEVKVDRAGLLPGDFRLVDRVDDFDLYRPPKDWTALHVADRTAEAHRILRRLPMTTHPKAFGSAMPEYVHEGVELAYQAGAGNLHQGKRMIRGTSADEVARMNEALGWPLTYLNNSPRLARALNEWASDQAVGECWPLDGAALEAATIVAEALNKGKAKVT